MEELKTALQNELAHVREVWFDQHNNWYIHNVPTAVRSMKRDEILASGEPQGEEGKLRGKRK